VFATGFSLFTESAATADGKAVNPVTTSAKADIWAIRRFIGLLLSGVKHKLLYANEIDENLNEFGFYILFLKLLHFYYE
jgi:hypothetical protein